MVSAGLLFVAAREHRRKEVINERILARRVGARKPNPNSSAGFTVADAPPAAINRALRREWAAVANRTLRGTGDPDAARRAGAEMMVAALECDALVQRSRRRTRGCAVPVNVAAAAKRRSRNCDQEADRAVDVILAGERP